jgi:hypothetical protein
MAWPPTTPIPADHSEWFTASCRSTWAKPAPQISTKRCFKTIPAIGSPLPPARKGVTGANTLGIGVAGHLSEPQDLNVIQAVIDFLKAPPAELSPAPAEAVNPGDAQPARFSQAHDLALAKAPKVKITAPRPGTVVAPGDLVPVSVSAPTATRVLVSLAGSVWTVAETAPFNVSLRLPAEALGKSAIAAFAWDANGTVGSTSVTVQAKTAATLQSLQVWPDTTTFLTPKQTLQLSVGGKFSDGIIRDLTPIGLGSTYKSDNTKVASVGKGRLVKAKTAGAAAITVKNGSLSCQVPITVAP